MTAQLLYRSKSILTDGAIIEMVVWRVPQRVEGSEHDYKYRLFYGRDGQRIVGYDNERGKGDHRHVRGYEEAYIFSTVEDLIADVLRNVEATRQRNR